MHKTHESAILRIPGGGLNDLLYYKYAIKTQVSHKPAVEQNFIKKEVMNYDNAAETPG